MSDVKENFDKLAKRELRDHGRNIIIAALSVLPVVGGSISSLLSEYIPEWKEKRVLNFIRELGEKLEEVKDRINQEYLKTEEFAFLFEQTFLRVFRDHQEEKLKVYKAILINSCTKSNFDTSEKEYFLSLVDRLQGVHILILSLFFNPDSFMSKHKVKLPEVTVNPKEIILTSLQPFNFGEELIVYGIRDLEKMGLLSNISGDMDIKSSVPAKTRLKEALSAFGKKFCEFIILE